MKDINYILKVIKFRTFRFLRRVFNTILYIVYPHNKILIVNCAFMQIGKHVVRFNLGDDINYNIFEYLSNGKLILNSREFYHPRTQNVVGIGSVIDWITNTESIIFGSGVMNPNSDLSAPPKKVLAVRGKLSREYLLQKGIECPAIYGDPAWLLPKIYAPKKSNEHKTAIGIIPHFVDKNNPIIYEFLKLNKNVRLIDIQNYKSWHDFVDQICSCRCIISSSLHGLIISDAYMIPNLWIKLSDNISGGGFKFHDYFSSLDRDSTCYNINNIEDLENVIHNGIFYHSKGVDTTALINIFKQNI